MRHRYGGQRSTYENQLSTSTMWVPGDQTGCQAWQQVPLLAQSSWPTTNKTKPKTQPKKQMFYNMTTE